MAIRDKAQKPAFVYSNIYELYKKAQAEKAEQAFPLSSSAKVWRAEELTEVKVTKFEPRTFTNTKAETKPVNPAMAPGSSPFEDLRANLNRLQDLHSRLRFMLKELEDLVNKKS